MHQPASSATGSASNPSPPVLEIPIDGLATGQGFVHPQWTLDQASGRVAVVQRAEMMSTWERVKYDLPDWLFFACLLLAPLLLWWTVRVLRRPRALGRLCCRRCGYDLTPEREATLIARCPECGTDTARRPPVLGRSRRRRLVVPVLGMGLLFGATAITASQLLTAYAPGNGTRRWPILLYPYLPGSTQWVHKDPMVSTSERIDVWSIAEKRLLISVPVDARHYGTAVREARLLAGGTLLGVTTETNGISQQLVRVSDGQVLWEDKTLAVGIVRAAGFAGVSADGSRAYRWSSRRTPSNGAEIELHLVDLATGKLTSVGTVTSATDPDVWGLISAAAREDGQTVRWACIVQDTPAATVLWPGHNAVSPTPVRARNAELIQDSATSAWYLVTPDARTGAGAPAAWRVRLDDGSSSRAPLVYLAGTGSTIAVCDPGTGATVKTLTGDGSPVAVVGWAFPGSRWHAAIGSRMSAPLIRLPGGASTPQSMTGVLQVWDITPFGASAP